jgi:hypothetical protein
MVDLTKNKIRPFFHIKNFKDGVADAVLGRAMTKAGRSSEYEEGYDFGLTLADQTPLTISMTTKKKKNRIAQLKATDQLTLN